ncbi:MAG: ABC transporter permease [Deltaproteobacteria bacterium]|nr:ABC transporter permease [Deltaproteobacteria bacterium]MBW2385732.1 ABC transporter permease [Deltaproteobacteria bacterium]
MSALDAQGLLEITLRTLGVCLSALVISLSFGVPIGIWLGRRQFPGRRVLLGLVNSGMGAPPIVVGLVVAQLFFRSGPLGQLELWYSVEAMITAQVLIALPLVVALVVAAVAALDLDWELQVKALGIPARWRMWLLLREIRLGLLAAVIAALGGILSEVGAVMQTGGNLEGETRVLTTAILMYTRMGLFESAYALAVVLIGLMLVLAGLLTWVQHGDRT